MKREILIDCDPGIDDTIALMMAFKDPSIEVIALTTVFGNASVEITTHNALILNDYFKFNVPVYKGAAIPLFHPRKYQSIVHGPNGMGNVDFPAPTSKVSPKYAWDAIYDEAKKRGKTLTVLTLGPLTNVAIAILRYEDLKEYVKEIIIMGGSATKGNAKPFGESNVVNDPYAMQVILNSQIPVTMVGLNATETTRMTEEEHKQIFADASKIDPLIVKMLTHYKGVQGMYGDNGMVIHDAATMAVVLHPEWATSRLLHVDVETIQNSMYGRTIVDIRKHSKLIKNCTVVETIERAPYLKHLEKTLKEN
ncbi:MAG: hypothetical protein FD179_1820 [Erysipelotrichaceae bacterium]|nr:MAG: hypothetical protein FD179_1820 [Erysipelotrichaceae bacterium]